VKAASRSQKQESCRVVIAAGASGGGGGTAIGLARTGWSLTGWVEALVNVAADVAVIGRVHSIMG
jgi:hypothetical protein